MHEVVKLNTLPSRFEELRYPITRVEAVAAYADVVVSLADGESNLGELLASVPAETFDGADELYAELNNVLPVEALGEPGQSEGDA
jgi:hypothetical protein